MRNCLKRFAVLALCIVMCIQVIPCGYALGARTLQVEQAQRMAVSASFDISKQSSQILLKKMKYVESVAGIKAKIKNLTSFRWSPLLNFKLPQPLDMTEEYDLNIKPLQLQSEIDIMQTKLRYFFYMCKCFI